MTITTTSTPFNAIKTNKTGLQNTSVTNGSVYFVADTKELFFDFDSQRVKVTDILILNTEDERTSILFSPLNKFYFVLATQILYLYKDGTWYPVTTGSIDLSNYYNKTEVNGLLDDKQDVLTAGTNITIENNVISSTGGASITVDSELSSSSENPVQNKVINSALADKLEATDLSATAPITYDSSTKTISANVDSVVGTNANYLVTSGAVETAIENAIVGGVTYKGTWTATSQTDYSSITTPVKKGWLYYVEGTATIGGIEWNTGDFLLINSNVSSSGTITDVKKIDNTEATDIVRLNATQVLTNKTIDADDNTISDLTTSNLKSGVLQTTVRATSSASDTSLASEKAIASALDNKQDSISDLTDIRSGATAGSTAVQPADLATVATTGDFEDLTNTPTIPTVNNSTITIKQGTTTKGTFTLNQSTDATINLDLGGSVVFRDWSVSS